MESHVKANACVTHGHMHANGHAYKMGSQFIEEGRRRNESRRKKKRERKERKKERNRRRKKNGENEVCVLTVGTRWTKK